NYGDPVEGEAEEPEKREFDPDAFVVVFECLSEGTGYGSFSFAPKISLGEGEVPFCNCVIDWGDGSEPEHVVEPIGKTHSYAKPGVYYATITGSTDYLSIGTNYYLKSIEQWGDLGIKTWFEAFKDCSQLASIPTEIPPSESFEGTFWNTGLKSIPAGLFSQCGSAKSFKYTFTACSKLETIGEGIFKNCISAEDFERTFTGCVNLKAIPADLFKDCINANSFLATFQGCIEVREIPEALFETCTKATDFLATFSSCYSLTSIPVSLFDYNLDVITFGSTFAGCTLAIGGTPNTNGIELWMRSDPQYTQYPDEIDVQGCFGGCKNLANYDDIPDEAK
ncbi:MAG: leucine-rich repeat domain-containing protein, partial [Tannerellaceae bacterium]|nr:leucine-rich repeat domain-containing protein [Tannerellaceae bacterium]